MATLHCVPPAPEVMDMLYMDYRRSKRYGKISFRHYLESIGFTNPAKGRVGMDDGARFGAGATGPELIDVPRQAVQGDLRVKVLLVDFPDRTGVLPKAHYDELLFSKGLYPTGSMRDFYREVSLGKVDISGSVHGWLRMPQPYGYYTHGRSGTDDEAYPNNARRLAEDAVTAALAQGVAFEPELDKLGQGIVTALFIVHAGRGAEVMPRALQGSEIWSHKWVMQNPVQISPTLTAAVYLVVPFDCKVGVCAHELGHLAFQWQDFYDPNYDEDGNEWDGAGLWDLMAGGSYNGGGARPAHPAGLHKLQHGWIGVTPVKHSRNLTIRPYGPKSGRVYKIVSSAYRPGQYLILENRSWRGFDADLPGEGLLVWRVDESGEQEASGQAGLLLIQADGRHNLEDPSDRNAGDAGDPFPGSAGRTKLGDTGSISTSFPDGPRSGVKLSNIRLDPATGAIKLKVVISHVASPAPRASGGGVPRRAPIKPVARGRGKSGKGRR
jgi:M6 family metalloprotease-like protein